jgi:hypothetical protein
MAVMRGHCFICDKTVVKTAIKNHLLKDHNEGGERCFLIKAEGAYSKRYWLYFSIPINATLSDMDHFLRKIWCECCGHLSAFRVGREELEMSSKLSSVFAMGTALLYEYDFGSTTTINVTAVSAISRPAQRLAVQVLARNLLPEWRCVKCGEPATQVNPWEREVLCGKCAEEEEDGDEFLPITNSPRCGICGYCGESDMWEV